MTDYTELVKRLRAECALPDESIKTIREAADAIEVLEYALLLAVTDIWNRRADNG